MCWINGLDLEVCQNIYDLFLPWSEELHNSLREQTLEEDHAVEWGQNERSAEVHWKSCMRQMTCL